jgi:hypothetical protein
MNPDILLNENALRNAIHVSFALLYADEYEAAGQQLPPSTHLEEFAPRQSDAKVMPFAWYLIGRLESAWGMPVGTVFYHAGIKSEEDQEHALSDLFLGLQGHGVTLYDEFEKDMHKAEEILKAEFDPAPFQTDLDSLRDLARAALEAWFIAPAPFGE